MGRRQVASLASRKYRHLGAHARLEEARGGLQRADARELDHALPVRASRHHVFLGAGAGGSSSSSIVVGEEPGRFLSSAKVVHCSPKEDVDETQEEQATDANVARYAEDRHEAASDKEQTQHLVK